MTYRIAAATLLVATLAFTAARGRHPEPADADRLAQLAKEFGTTPDRMAQFIREGMGDPVIVDDGLMVGVHRDAAGRVQTVKITTALVTFNRDAGDGRPGLDYFGGDLAPNVPFTSATDLDGDARIDLILIRNVVTGSACTSHRGTSVSKTGDDVASRLL